VRMWVKSAAQTLQWATNVIATDPNAITSPPVVIILYTLALIFSMIDIFVEFLAADDE